MMTRERKDELRQEFLHARQNPGYSVDFATEEKPFLLSLIRGEKTPATPVPAPRKRQQRLIDLVTPAQEEEMVLLLKTS